MSYNMEDRCIYHSEKKHLRILIIKILDSLFFNLAREREKSLIISYPKYPLFVFWELPVFFPIMIVILVAYAYSFNLFFHYVI